MPPTDENIISLMQSSKEKEQGFHMLVRAYQSKLYWHIRRFLVIHEATEDTLQETFIKVYQNFNQFKKESKLYTWLYRIATNEALQQLEKIKKMHKTDDNITDFMHNKIDDNALPNADEIQIGLQKAIQSLPEKQKLVFSMRYYDEIPYDEMSKILDMSVGTLKTNYHYAKQKIEDFLQNHF